MNTPEKAGQKVTVAPFWRGHVHIAAEDYDQLRNAFESKGPDALRCVLEVLPHLSAVVRHNVQRILSAAIVAEHEHGKVLLVEGCRANSIEKQEGEKTLTRNLTGSHVGMLIGRALRNAGVISSEVPFEHVSESRCTDWEADILLEKVATDERLIGIAGPYNEPSPERAGNVVEKLAKERHIDARVYSPEQALDEFNIELSVEQQAVLKAAALTEKEILQGIENERKASRIQSVSDKFRMFGLKGRHSLIALLARIIPSRWDKNYRN